MLILAGLGLCDEKDLNLRIIEEAKSCDKIFFENYTGIWKGSIENLEKIFEKKILKAERKDLEENIEKIIEDAKKEKIMILVQGDPLILTTHISIIDLCINKNVEYKIIHNTSLINLIAKTGLHIQKFGRIVTIHKKFDAPSVKSQIEENLKNNLHTLCSCDPDLSLNEAIEIIKSYGICEKIVVIINGGCDNEKIIFSKLEKLEIDEKPFCIIIPSKNLHFTEREFLEKFIYRFK